MLLFGLCGHDGAGKTHTLLQLVPELTKRGHSVSVLREMGLFFDMDKPGKDSYEHRKAGATEVLIACAERNVLMHEYDDEMEMPHGLSDLLERIDPVDIVLVEGFGMDDIARVEVWRDCVDPAMLAETTLATFSQQPPGSSLPHMENIGQLADFIEARL